MKKLFFTIVALGLIASPLAQAKLSEKTKRAMRIAGYTTEVAAGSLTYLAIVAENLIKQAPTKKYETILFPLFYPFSSHVPEHKRPLAQGVSLLGIGSAGMIFHGIRGLKKELHDKNL